MSDRCNGPLVIVADCWSLARFDSRRGASIWQRLETWRRWVNCMLWAINSNRVSVSYQPDAPGLGGRRWRIITQNDFVQL